VYKLWSSSLCSLLQLPATSSVLDLNFLLRALPFGLRFDEMASRYGVLLHLYWISSRGQVTRGDHPAWRVGEIQPLTVKNHIIICSTRFSSTCICVYF
jgi:hypothetical protein